MFLPLDLLLLIFRFLDPRELLRVHAVCPLWRQLLSSHASSLRRFVFISVQIGDGSKYHDFVRLIQDFSYEIQCLCLVQKNFPPSEYVTKFVKDLREMRLLLPVSSPVPTPLQADFKPISPRSSSVRSRPSCQEASAT